MKLNSALQLFLCALLMTGLNSCGSSSKDDKSTDSTFQEAEGTELKDQIEDVVYNIPSPTEIPYILQATGAEFNQSLLNPKGKADQYVTRNDKAALNLGVYVTDIGYLSSYEKTQEAIDYLNAAKKLADNLAVTGTFDIALLERFESNISNKDSLARILNTAVQRTESFLKDDSRNKLAALVIAGSFVEGLYISTGLVKSYPKNLLPDDKRNLVLTPIMRVILEQKKSVGELSKMLASVEQTEPVPALVADLNELEKAYSALNVEEQIKNNRADLLLSDKNLTEITNIIEKMRSHITE